MLLFHEEKELGHKTGDHPFQDLTRRSPREAFQAFVADQTKKFNLGSNQIINMDEVLLTFNIPMNRTIDSKGTSSVNIRTTAHEKLSFTVVLECIARGKNLPPMVIFKKMTAIKDKFWLIAYKQNKLVSHMSL